MNKRVKRVLQIGIPVVIVLLILVPRLNDSFTKRQRSGQGRRGMSQGILPVSGCVAGLSMSNNGIMANGTLLPNEEVELVSETAGKVDKIYFNDGDHVKKGKLLLKVDDSDLKAQLERAEFEKKLLEDKLERQRILLKRESVSYESFQQMETEYNMLLADIELLKVKIARTEIRAPFDGKMGFRYVSEGSYVQPSTRVSSLVDNSVLKIEFSIPEKYINVPLIGKKIKFRTEGIEKDIIAEIYAVDPQADIQTHMITLRARYRNTANLVAGMFVKGELMTESNRTFMMIPSEAVVPEMNGKRLWVVKEGKALSVPVETESRDSRYVEVISGIQPGDTVLTGGLMQLQNGMRVSVSLAKETSGE
ncbi:MULTISPECIES: efflux RND transporter periplasmic adaptor subunit [Sanguibacteroides]|uniref:RND transporter n=1 Tax=Sanguibacteroides justesenii TaxID=1547597 RepID=A0A0C3RCX8_9PORP|nr:MULTISPECIES: efflux RND transporter periplasmic adaptor subunit [Sanguibacteroides]KIO43966.1 RND transporter [Sanguibacteroides justesenii]KIO46534.1 RND transporter [Sanguibacteroides justesenii]PXZ43998.1 efflux RND transporter periplasmic adaptor subunit [Sanguibacteroides justesenii]